ARDLIARAERDEAYPIPVVIPLSTWAEKQLPLADWLIEELNRQYDVPKKVGQAWVGNDLMLLLLDGLDEVKANVRAACVEAINTFRAEHGLAAMTVCSRIGDYENLTVRLRLRSAITLQPLKVEQVDAHLARFGTKLTLLRRLIQERADLQELAANPLMLGILMIVYQDADNEKQGPKTFEGQLTYLFSRYVQHMLTRPEGIRIHFPSQPDEEGLRKKGNITHYTPEQIKHWLTWLAKKLQRHSVSIFYPEAMRPNWLPSVTHQKLLTWGIASLAGLSIALVFGLIGGLAFGLLSGLFASFREGFISGMVSGLRSGLIGGLAVWLNKAQAEIRYPTRRTPYEGMKRLSLSGLISGLVGGLVGGLFFGLLGGLVF
ncbi:MAG: hypothetical protein MN733_22300, partial [Nitrososphaera sp.]|nr:hypothetical protein [Nitrososphaera sp.]